MTSEELAAFVGDLTDVQLGFLEIALRRERNTRRQQRWDEAKAEIERILKNYDMQLSELRELTPLI